MTRSTLPKKSPDPNRGVVDELPEVFERFGRIDVRRMFGGYGLFHEDRMFGLVAGGRVYLKTDDENRAAFQAKGLLPFEYARRGEMTATSYYEAPAEIFEDRQEAARWAQLAWGAVLRKGSEPTKKRKSAKAKATVRKTTATKPTARKAAAAKKVPSAAR